MSVPCDIRIQLPRLPKSATGEWAWVVGPLAFVLGAWYVRSAQPFQHIAHNALLVLAVLWVSLGLPELFALIHSGGWHQSYPGNLSRYLYKLVGLIGSVGAVAAAYFLFPEYIEANSAKPFYANYWELIRTVGPWVALVAPVYLYFADRYASVERDGYWHLGRFLCGKSAELKPIGQVLLGWGVKGFFAPLMFTYFCRDLSNFMTCNFSLISNFSIFYDVVYHFLFFIDVGLASAAYLATISLLKTQTRSVEPTAFGWGVALICYQPFWSLAGKQYIAYGDGIKWDLWLKDLPVIKMAWGISILFLIGIYLWATAAFGLRFSNLTHRGVITSGPYRFTKHPAYLAKNLAWWLISVPFIVSGSWVDSLKSCVLLLMLNGIYWLRAKTEERHLSQDSTYLAYAQWIQSHGLCRHLDKLPILAKLRSVRL